MNIDGKIILAWLLVCAATAFGMPLQETAKHVAAPIEVSQVSDSQVKVFAEWIDKNAEDSFAFVIAKCREHQLVMFGESHNKKEQVDFFRKVAIEAYHKAGVRVVALECCNAEDNEKLARLVNGSEYDEALCYEIARSDGWGLWGYKEYWDLLKDVWKLNRSLPEGSEPMTVIGIDIKVDLQLKTLWKAKQLKDPELIEKAKSQTDASFYRDEWLMAHIDNEIIAKGRKGIVLVGFNHSFTHYSQSDFDNKTKGMTALWSRMGVLLHRKYGDKIFQIGFDIPFGPSLVLREGDKGGAPVINSFFRNVMAARGNKAAAFDVPGSPFGILRDGRAEYFYWQPQAKLEDLFRGYIYLKPYDELSPCGWLKDYISDAMFEKSRDFYKYAFKRDFRDSREINEFMASGKAEF